MGNQWGDIYLCVPSNQNVGGRVPPPPPYNRRPWILDSLGYCVAFFAWSSWLSCFNRTPTLTDRQKGVAQKHRE